MKKQNPSSESLLRPETWLGESLNRREFLKKQVRGMLWVAVGTAGLRFPGSVMAQDVPDLAIAKGGPGPATRAVVNLLGGMKAFVKSGDKVVIKPNMSFAHDVERATNTHPEVVRELAAMCKEAGASRVRVLDHPLRSSELCIEGVKEACSVFNEDMVHGLSKSDFFKPVEIPQGENFKETDVMQDVLEADVLIAVPVAKSHASTGVSLSMKGMMGLIWDRGVMHGRYDLHSAIVDLCTLLRPRLVVVDATRALTTNGPSGPGKVVQLDTVIASRDMVAADAQTIQMVEWYGRRFEPRQVKHIRIAHERKLGRMDIENLSVKRVEA